MNVYEIVTKKVIEQLEKGVIPWHKPWKGSSLPRNLITGKPYRGINMFLLWQDQYPSRYWLTFNQIKNLGGHVKKGEKSSLVVFFKMLENLNQDDPEKKLFVLRYYNVFNASQAEGLKHKRLTEEAENIDSIEFNAIEECEAVWAGYESVPRLTHDVQKAFYSPSDDYINMPAKTSFDSEEFYYSILFHEAIHSTGHTKRLGRSGITDIAAFGSHEYSKEELIAEMGAAMLCAHTGIDSITIDNSASYINSWLTNIKQSKNFRLVVDAAAAAQKAVDMILGNQDHQEEGA